MENPFKQSGDVLHCRAQEIRKKICVMNATAKSGHTGGDMSEADILAALYFHVLRAMRSMRTGACAGMTNSC